MIDFVAFDFETATGERNSACELGLTVVEDGKIAQTHNWLLKPPSWPYFHPGNVRVHGITPQDVAEAPTFSEAWPEISQYFYGQLAIAHNASFDASVLRACLTGSGNFLPKMNYLCSISVAKKAWSHLPRFGLAALAEHHGIRFNHHRADADARVCAEITLLALDQLMLTRTQEMRDYFAKNVKSL